jgi:orotidine-5'-phosphate decarboxylase
LCSYLKERYPNLGTIADGKHGDIGNTNDQLTKYYLDELGFDSMTLNPFMGFEDCMDSFLRKWAEHDFFLLGLTSNVGSKYFMRDNIRMIANFAQQENMWNENGNLNYVVGGTNPPEKITSFREYAGNKPMFLKPGYGAQGGALLSVVAGKAEGASPNVLPMLGRQLIAPERQPGESYEDAVTRTAKYYQDEFARLLGLQVAA